MRDPQVIEAELLEIGSIQDDVTKLERILTWSASHPDEIGFALRFFSSGNSAGLEEWVERHSPKE